MKHESFLRHWAREMIKHLIPFLNIQMSIYPAFAAVIRLFQFPQPSLKTLSVIFPWKCHPDQVISHFKKYQSHHIIMISHFRLQNVITQWNHMSFSCSKWPSHLSKNQIIQRTKIWHYWEYPKKNAEGSEKERKKKKDNTPRNLPFRIFKNIFKPFIWLILPDFP